MFGTPTFLRLTPEAGKSQTSVLDNKTLDTCAEVDSSDDILNKSLGPKTLVENAKARFAHEMAEHVRVVLEDYIKTNPQLKDDRAVLRRTIQILGSELAVANQELGRQHRLLNNKRSKNETLDIYLEPGQGEVDFLKGLLKEGTMEKDRLLKKLAELEARLAKE